MLTGHRSTALGGQGLEAHSENPLASRPASVILTGMPYTLRNFTVSRVAGADSGSAMAWLERRRAWDDRLVELERGLGSPEHDRRRPGTPVRVVGGDRVGT